jgi:hypothetical protein
VTFEAKEEQAAKRRLLRHGLATIAYRGGKVLRDAPKDFSSFKIAESSRSPGDILAHIGDLLDWALSLAHGDYVWHDSTLGEWDREVARFYKGLERLDAFLASAEALGTPPEQLLQGPIGDALTHVGQLAMLRRLAGSPVKGESYFQADIAIGRVGPVQSSPRKEFS